MTELAFLGGEGSFSGMAADLYNLNDKYELKPCSSIDNVINLVYMEKTELGIVPVKTSKGFTKYRKIIKNKGLQKVADISIHVPMAVGGLSYENNLESIFSKQEALEQCTNYIQFALDEDKLGTEHQKGNESEYIKRLNQMGKLVFTDSTSEAAKKIIEKEDLTAAAIASCSAIESAGLKIYRKNINDDPNSRTLFYIVRKG